MRRAAPPGPPARLQTALHLAADRGHGTIAEMLVDSGAELDRQDVFGWRCAAAGVAAAAAASSVIAAAAAARPPKQPPVQPAHSQPSHARPPSLLTPQSLAKCRPACVHHPRSPLMLAVDSSAPTAAAVARLLVGRGAALDLATTAGWTALHLVRGGRESGAPAGCAAHAPTCGGQYQGCCSCRCSSCGGAASAVRRPASLARPRHHDTQAADDGRADLARLLIRAGCRLDALDVEECTPLMLAADDGARGWVAGWVGGAGCRGCLRDARAAAAVQQQAACTGSAPPAGPNTGHPGAALTRLPCTRPPTRPPTPPQATWRWWLRCWTRAPAPISSRPRA